MPSEERFIAARLAVQSTVKISDRAAAQIVDATIDLIVLVDKVLLAEGECGTRLTLGAIQTAAGSLLQPLTAAEARAILHDGDSDGI